MCSSNSIQRTKAQSAEKATNMVIMSKVHYISIDEEHAGQRLDNFLKSQLKGVPISRIQRIIRKGETRINKQRVKGSYRLSVGDLVRIPPIQTSPPTPTPKINSHQKACLEDCILFEDNHLIILNKPSGLAVHGGSGINHGLIEQMRAIRPLCKHLELVHRLDKETSGCLMIAKKRSTLRTLHEQIRQNTIKKSYQLLVAGNWPKGKTYIDAPLLKHHLTSGERIVVVHREGKEALTYFKVLQRFEQCTLLEATLTTGRTHQIRVHTQYAGHSILGDNKYGNDTTKQLSKQLNIKRLFLHASHLQIRNIDENVMAFDTSLPENLKQIIDSLSLKSA